MNFIFKVVTIGGILIAAGVLMPYFKDFVDTMITPTGGWLRSTFGVVPDWVVAFDLFLPWGFWILIIAICIFIGFKKDEPKEPPRIIR